MTQARRETSGGAGGVANDDPAQVSRGAEHSLVRLKALGGFGRAERHPSGATALPGSGGGAPGERQLERRPAGPECQLISE